MNHFTITLKKYDDVYFQAILDKPQYFELRKFLTFKAKDYLFSPKFKAGIWDGNITYLDKDGKFPIGLYSKFCEFCEKFSYKHILDFPKNSFGNKMSDETLESFLDVVFPPDVNIYPYDHQIEAISKAIQFGRGVLNLATSSGKSLIIYSLVRYLLARNKRLIIIVPNISLVEQLYSDFKNDYGWENAGKHVCLNYGGKQLDLSKSILLTTWQSVYKNDDQFFSVFDSLIVDEAHSMKGKSISEIGKKCSKADFRIGLTGTMPENEADFSAVVGYLGPVIHKVMSKELIDKGIISQIKIKNLLVRYPEEMKVARKNYQKEVDDIGNYPNRNKALDHIINSVKPKENVLILVTKIEHLRGVKLYIEKNFKKRTVYEIYGKTDGDAREEIRRKLEKEEDAILVASYGTFSTGANVKKLHHIVLYSSYKSQIKVLQSIGRGLRKHETKEFVTIWDVVDDLRYTDGRKTFKNHTYRHWEQNRLKYYEEQQFDYTNDVISI